MAQHLAYLTGTPMLQQIIYLAIISFYYLLRSEEYTKPRKVKQNVKLVRSTRTQQFKFKMWVSGKMENISSHKALNKMLGADSATLKLSNKKNIIMGQTLYHESAGIK